MIKLGAGGDDQSHVSDPQIKYNMQLFSSTQRPTSMVKRDMRYLLSKNLSKRDLEPIQEQVREENHAFAAAGFAMT